MVVLRKKELILPTAAIHCRLRDSWPIPGIKFYLPGAGEHLRKLRERELECFFHGVDGEGTFDVELFDFGVSSEIPVSVLDNIKALSLAEFDFTPSKRRLRNGPDSDRGSQATLKLSTSSRFPALE